MFGSHIDLMPDEEMILASNPHWFYFWKQVAAAIVILVTFVLLSRISWLEDFIGWVALIAFVVLIIDVIVAFLQWQTTRFAITDQRVAYQSGMFRRRGVSIPLNRINNVNFDQSMIARILNNGIVTIESAGETGDSVFENIPKPEHVRTLIFAQVEADEQRDSDRDAASLAKALRDQQEPIATTASTPPPPPTPPSSADRLAALDDLKAQGHIDDAEYAAKRQQILDEL